jgi:hypothetical protein
MTLLQKKKLRKTLTKIIRNKKKLKLYLLNLHWLRIKKQKERRRKKTLIKLYKMRRIHMMKSMLRSA